MMVNKWESGGSETVLVDNVKDRYQLKNIAKKRPDVVKELTVKLNAMLKKYNDPWVNS